MGSGGAIGVYNLANESIAEGYSLGNTFTAGAAYTIYGVRWSRHLTAPFPTKLYLYDATSSTTVATWTPADGDWWQVDNEWWDFDLDRAGLSTVALTSSHAYFITYYLGAANSWQRYNGSAAPYVGITFTSSRYQLADTPTPSGVASGSHGIDVRVVPWPEPTQSGTAPATGADLTGGLAEWFSSNGAINTHEGDGTPWQTLQDVATWLSRGGQITGTDETTYGLRDATLAGALVKVLQYLVTNGSNINGLISALGTVKGWLGDNGSAPSEWDMYGQVQDMSTKLYAIDAKLDAMLAPPPSTSWVSQGTMGFDTNLAWTQPADVYTVTYSDLGSASVNLTIGSAEVAYRLAWWAVWDGERMRDRRFADGVLPVLYDGGARMPGIVLHSPAGASGTVEAWTLS